ncbi:MAG: hypothetical protein ABJA64_01300 [Candidatus Saccharibacteria bacterium]
MNTNSQEKSVAYNLLAHPNRNVIVGLTLVGIAAIGASTASHDRNLRDGAIAVCTGDQKITVTNGNTLEGIIEAEVRTSPKDRLKSDVSLAALAKAATLADIRDDDGKPIFVYSNDSYKQVGSANLEAGETIFVPVECHTIS